MRKPVTDLKPLFQQIWNELGFVGDWRPHWREREKHYTEDWRSYHSLDHACHVVTELQSVRHKLERPAEILLAGIDHDVELVHAINGKPVKHNEIGSALFTLRTVIDADGSVDMAVRVALAIIATDHHPRAGISEDAKYLCDADKAILGQRWATYGQYAFRSIPLEYQHFGVTPQAFAAGRLAFLKKLRQQPIYLTDHFRQLYEEMAQLNIDEEVRILTKQLAQS
jgi:predicted metal-dependent HD superfamily phosphohydrolase